MASVPLAKCTMQKQTTQDPKQKACITHGAGLEVLLKQEQRAHVDFSHPTSEPEDM